jgi:hypothetical protein
MVNQTCPHGERFKKYQDRKAAARRASTVIPKRKYMQMFLKTTRENMGIKETVPQT